MHITITKEDTSDRPKLKFLCVIRTEARPTRAAKDAKLGTIRFKAKKARDRSLKIDGGARGSINEMGCS